MLLLTVGHLSAHAQGCSDAVTRIILEGDENAHSNGPFGALLRSRGSVPIPSPTADVDQICRFALTAAIQNSRSTRDAIARALHQLAASRENDAAVQYAIATSRNQNGLATYVLSDSSARDNEDPLVRYEFARAHFLAGDPDEGLRVLSEVLTDSPAAATLLLHSTYPALSSEARDRIEGLPLPERGETLLRMWDQMAWSSGLTLAERLAIHFQRVVHADSMYFGVRRASGDSTAVINSEAVKPDPRREVYIRFGQPWRIVHTPILRRGTSQDSETWVFADPTQREPMLFHFTGANANYSLVTNLGCNVNWLSDRASLTPRLGEIFQACTTQSGDTRAVIADHRRRTLDAYDTNLEREFVVPSTLGARFAYQLYTFRSHETSLGEIVAVAQVPARDIPRTGALRAGVFLRDGSNSMRSQLVDHKVKEPGDAMLVMTIPDVPEGDYSYRIRVSDLAFEEGFVYGGEYTVALDGSGSLRISDLVIARTGATGALRRGTEALQPIVGVISEREFDLYGEAYGLSAGEAVDVEIIVSRDGGLFRRRTEVALRFSDTVGDDGRFAFRRLIQHDLEPGEYELTVKLRSDSAGNSEKTTRIEIG